MCAAGTKEVAAAMVENDEARGIAARGQDQIAVTRSALHALDADILCYGQLTGDILDPCPHYRRGGICGNGILGTHFKNCSELLCRHFCLLRTREEGGKWGNSCQTWVGRSVSPTGPPRPRSRPNAR